MSKEKILGLDIGSNSVGWALIEKDVETGHSTLLDMGSRIISLGLDKTNFEQGKTLTRNADRRTARQVRKLNKRYKQRRNKLIYVLKELNLLPEFIKWTGAFPESKDIQKLNLLPIEKGTAKKVNALKIFEQRKDALTNKVEFGKDLGRILYSFNQLRGYAGGDNQDEDEGKEPKGETETGVNKKVEIETVTVLNIKPKQKTELIKKGKGKTATEVEIPIYKLTVKDIQNNNTFEGWAYKEKSVNTITAVEVWRADESVNTNCFFQFDDAPLKTKFKKGWKSLNNSVQVQSCIPWQDMNRNKWLYELKLKGGREGILALSKIEMADSYVENAEKELQVVTIEKEGKIYVEFYPVVKTSWRREMESFDKKMEELAKEKGRKVFLSEYFYEELKKNKWFKVRTRVIQRRHYKSEFDRIWDEQAKHCPILNNPDKDLLERISDYLFPGKSESQQKLREEAIKGGLKYIIKEQIIYYQRPLKPQFNLIANCQYEHELKVIPQSHPMHQERAIWECINRLRINTLTEEKNGKKKYADKILTAGQKKLLFEELQQSKELTHQKVKQLLNIKDGAEWLNGLNYKSKLKGAVTKIQLRGTFNRIAPDLFRNLGLENEETLIELWRVLFNWVKKEYDQTEIAKDQYNHNPKQFHVYDPNDDNEGDPDSARVIAVSVFLKELFAKTDHIFDDNTAAVIAKIRFSRSYSSLSSKANKNILPLLRSGEFYKATETDILPVVKERICLLADNAEAILGVYQQGEEDTFFEKSLIEHFLDPDLHPCFHEGGLMYSDAVTLVYGKHTGEVTKPEDSLKNWNEIKFLDNGELRSPVVEQITNETLRVIQSLWKKHQAKPDKIRVELARELKSNAEEREKIQDNISKNEKLNSYVRKRLIELKQSLPSANTVNLRENPSARNIEIYKLWHLQTTAIEPRRTEMEKYKAWVEQDHLSPYTKKPIPLSRLFSGDYQLDHIIPVSRSFDDSLTNKVVCESHINSEKGQRTAWEYMSSSSKYEERLSFDGFQSHVNGTFKGKKRKNLLADKISEDFISRQLKETQYASKKVKELLGKIVGTENVLSTTGGVTDYLRNEWGLTEKFKELTKDRYEKMGLLTKEDGWVKKEFDEERNKHYLKVKLWSKRHDHRHHAIDALVVAATEQSHVQRLNNLNKEFQSFFAELALLLSKQKVTGFENFEGTEKEFLLAYSKFGKEKLESISQQVFQNVTYKKKDIREKTGNGESLFRAFLDLGNDYHNADKQKEEKYAQDLIRESMPSFRRFQNPLIESLNEVKGKINRTIVAHKPKNQLLYQKDKSGKTILKIRGELHEGTLYGSLKNVEVAEPVYKIKLTSLGSSQKTKSAVEDAIGRIVSKSLKNELTRHLSDFDNKHTLAFSDDGIRVLNEGRVKAKKHPVFSVKIKKQNKAVNASESLLKLYRDPNNQSLFVNTGNNYCMGVTLKNKKREFGVISLFNAVSEVKQFETETGRKDILATIKRYFTERHEETKGGEFLFTLSINDLVYVPINEQLPSHADRVEFEKFWSIGFNPQNVYKVVKMTGKRCYFVPHTLTEEITYKPIKIIDGEEVETTLVKEYGENGGCSEFVEDIEKAKNVLLKKDKSNAKKRLEEELDNTYNLYVQAEKEKKEDTSIEYLTKIAEIISANSDINLSNHFKKKNISLHGKLKELLKVIEKSDPQDKFEGVKIQDRCIKLQVDRLGNIKPA